MIMKWYVYIGLPIVLVVVEAVWKDPSTLVRLLLLIALLVVLTVLFIIIRIIVTLYCIDTNRKKEQPTEACPIEETDQALHDKNICFVPSF